MAKIVFIEDEPALQKTLGSFLREGGHTVVSALEGEGGLKLIQTENPELVLLDLILPRLSGLEVLEAMRKDPHTQSIPVIVLTNVESSDSVEKAMSLGAMAYLVKTNYSLSEVGEKIESVLRHARERPGPYE